VKSPSVRRASTLAFALTFAVLACTPADPDPATRDATPADTSAAGSETATGADTLPGARVAWEELSPGSGVPDSVPLTAVTDSVVHAVAERRWDTLAALAHPEHGIRFSPYGYVDT